MVYSNLQEIATAVGYGQKKSDSLKVKSLIDSKVLSCFVNDSGLRARYYLTDSMVQFSLQCISNHAERNQKKLNSLREQLQYADFLSTNMNDKLFKELYPAQKTQIITMTILKGGVGKTTTAVNVATILAAFGKKVLIVDTDPQANTTHYFSDESYAGRSLSSLLEQFTMNNATISREEVESKIVSFHFSSGSVDILPSELKLGRSLEILRGVNYFHLSLSDILKSVMDKYEYIIIDTPPSSIAGLTLAYHTADKIVFPVNASKHAVDGLRLTLQEISGLGSREGLTSLKKDKIFVTSYEGTSGQQKCLQDIEDMAVEFGIDDVKIIKKSSVVESSQIFGLPLISNNSELKLSMVIAEPMIDYAVEKMLEK
ncbi:MAG: ParA family protein [Campylobacteraceae bacterium]|jgi:chromosome partitioning protein|nr:ParA family protein [Campylobacteraceae bacterium]